MAIIAAQNRASGQTLGQISGAVAPFSMMARTTRRKCVSGITSPIAVIRRNSAV